MKHTIIVLVAALSGLTAIAQQHERMTAEQFRARVVDYNYALKMSREAVSASESKFKAARTGFLPSLSVDANASYTVGNTISFGSMTLKDYNYTSSLTLTQAVYAGGSARNRTKAAKTELQVAELSEQDALQNVLYGADVTYLAVVASTEQMAVADRYVEIVRSLYNTVNDRFKDGYVSKTDLLMVENRLNEALMQQITAKKLYLNSLQSFNTMIGADPAFQYSLDTMDYGSASRSLSFTEVNNYSDRADYLATLKNVELAQANLRVARVRYNPQLHVGIQGIYGTPSLNFTGEAKGYGAAFAQFTAPIFMWGERRHTIAAARSAIRSAELAVGEKEDAIRGEISRAMNDVEKNGNMVDLSRQSLQVASDNLELNTFSYSEGKLPILDVLQSQLSWIQSYTNMVNSTYSYLVSAADYRKAIGAMEIK